MMHILVTFLSPYLAEIWPAGTERTATTSKKIMVTQFCMMLLIPYSAAMLGITIVTALTAKTVKNDSTVHINKSRFFDSIIIKRKLKLYIFFARLIKNPLFYKKLIIIKKLVIFKKIIIFVKK